MQTCKTCRHWQKPHGWRGDEWAGGCRRQGLDDAGPTAFTVTAEGSNAADLLTGPDFGCIAHEPEAETVQEDDGA